MQSYFHFDSLTNAQSAKQLLARHGFSSVVRRDPHPDMHRGCGFAVYVRGNMKLAQQLLAAHGLLSAQPRNS